MLLCHRNAQSLGGPSLAVAVSPPDGPCRLGGKQQQPTSTGRRTNFNGLKNDIITPGYNHTWISMESDETTRLINEASLPITY